MAFLDGHGSCSTAIWPLQKFGSTTGALPEGLVCLPSLAESVMENPLYEPNPGVSNLYYQKSHFRQTKNKTICLEPQNI